MNANRLLAHYETIADAPDAIARLRRFVLDLAVRGKLVPQDPNDEPASELLKRIAAEKLRLVKAGEIRKPKPLETLHESPFQIPSNWTWTRLGNITSYIQRGKSPKYAIKDGAPVISQKCVQWSGLDLSVAKQITLESLSKYEPIRFLREGDLLWNSTGTGTIGRVVRLTCVPPRLVCDSHVTVVRCLEVKPEYVRTWLRTDDVYGIIEERAAGSTNQVELTAQMANGQPIPLPPLAEQRRIVAKVDELMGLLDGLEAARAEREAVRDRLTTASLARLTAKDAAPGDFPAHARFALDALPALTARPDQVKTLRQTILNLAVRGKLVEQDPTDEPAEELLKRISKERAARVIKGELRKAKGIAPPSPDAQLFELPEKWEWSVADQLWDFENGDRSSNYPSRDQLVATGIPFVNAGHLVGGRVSLADMNYITSAKFASLGGGKLRHGDHIYCLRGSLGKHAIFDLDCDAAIASSLVILRPVIAECVPYLSLYLDSDIAQTLLRRFDNGSAQPNLSSANLRRYEVPLPPLAEQGRIVAKVDALMALCDRLEAALTTASRTRARLLEALLHEALAPPAAKSGVAA